MADATGSAASTMRAGDVGRAARNDLQFRIPRKPAVRRGVRMRLDDGAWVLDGGRKNQTLGGRFAREHLGALLQACDGTRTLAEIGEATGIGPQGAFEAVGRSSGSRRCVRARPGVRSAVRSATARAPPTAGLG